MIRKRSLKWIKLRLISFLILDKNCCNVIDFNLILLDINLILLNINLILFDINLRLLFCLVCNDLFCLMFFCESGFFNLFMLYDFLI